MSKKNILVFPCGSEVALEVHRSLQYSIHINLIGGNSIDDHGKFIFENYIGGIPFVNNEDFIPAIKDIVEKYKIDAIYPAMDNVIAVLKKNEEKLHCKVISSGVETNDICISKSKTYKKLKKAIPTPKVYFSENEIINFPVFLKPDIGYGSRGTKVAYSIAEIRQHQKDFSNILIMEYLPGKEYTVDCFTNFKGDLLFVGPRQRKRISNGISVNTSSMLSNKVFLEIAKKITQKIAFNGSWFFQVKERNDGTLVIMEIAARLGGSSAVYRMKGINFAMLSVFNAFEIPVSIVPNDYKVEMDRAFDCKFKILLDYKHVYIDFDDVVIINGMVNVDMISAIFHFINNGKKIHLITKHEKTIAESLKKFRLDNLFDEIIHLEKDDQKWRFINHKDSIFIDDSFAERKEVKENLGLSVFSPDMVAALI